MTEEAEVDEIFIPGNMSVILFLFFLMHSLQILRSSDSSLLKRVRLLMVAKSLFAWCFIISGN